jgi:LysR family transcriptional activator of nhaA
VVRAYADEIFELGDALQEAVREARKSRVRPLRVGIAEVVPKSLAHELLSPALELDPAPRLYCREDSLPRLLAELALHRLDLVISDRAPAGSTRSRSTPPCWANAAPRFWRRRRLREGCATGFRAACTAHRC